MSSPIIIQEPETGFRFFFSYRRSLGCNRNLMAYTFTKKTDYTCRAKAVLLTPMNVLVITTLLFHLKFKSLTATLNKSKIV